MNKKQLGVWVGLLALLLAVGCKEDKQDDPLDGSVDKATCVIQYDWVETPKEVQVPKGTTLFVYPKDGGKPECIETGLDGYVVSGADRPFDLAVCNRDLVHAVVGGEGCLDSLCFRLQSTSEGFLKEPGWLLGGVEKEIRIEQEQAGRWTVKMRPFVHRIVLRDASLNDASVVSYTGCLEGLAAGVRLADRFLLPEVGAFPIQFEKTDSGWVSSFLSLGVHPDYPCRLSCVVTLSDGRVRKTVVDLTQQASATRPKEPGEQQLLVIKEQEVTAFNIRATTLSLSDDNLLLGTEQGVYASHHSGGWTTPEQVVDPRRELGQYPIRSVVLSGTNGLVADTKDRCWWLTKTAAGWQVARIPVPVSAGSVKEVVGFGAALAINGHYAAISAPRSTLGVYNEMGNYNQYDGAGAVYLYSVGTLKQGAFRCRSLLPSPLTAQTGYGQSLAIDANNRMAIGVNRYIRSFAADFVALLPQEIKRIPYGSSPALGCPFVLTDGGMMLAGAGTGTFQYTLSGTTLLLIPAALPVVEDKDAWSLSGKNLVIKGMVYQLTDKGWKPSFDLLSKLSRANSAPAGWGACSSLNGNRVAVCSDEQVYIFNF